MAEAHLDSVKKIADIFDFLIAHPGDVGVSELSRELGMSRSVVHRFLVALEAHGFLMMDHKSHRYSLGNKMLQLGLLTINRLDIRQLALPRMERLRSVTKESVHLSLKVGDRRVYIEALDSPQPIRIAADLGRDAPLYVGGSSKAILAFLENEVQKQILADAEGRPLANGKVLSKAELRAELQAIRRRGYASSVSERIAGAFSVAAPVFSRLGQVAGSISISGPTARWRGDLAEQYGPLVVTEARGLSSDIGFSEDLRQTVK